MSAILGGGRGEIESGPSGTVLVPVSAVSELGPNASPFDLGFSPIDYRVVQDKGGGAAAPAYTSSGEQAYLLIPKGNYTLPPVPTPQRRPRPRPQEPERPPETDTEDPIFVDPPEGCPDPNTLILLADGSQKRAGDLQVGDVVRTQHEDTLEWGEHKVTYVEIKNSDKLSN